MAAAGILRREVMMSNWLAPAFPCLAFASASAAAQQTYVVIRNGRVTDPESRLDAVRSLGIRGGRVAAIATGALRGRDTIDARGLVVAPGFIDLHVHWQAHAS